MGPKLKNFLPPFYQQILPDDILGLEINETKATCEACIKVPQYKENLKCCTFHPFLPNYLIGQILVDQKLRPTFITETLQHKISKRQYALPLGIVAPVRYQVEFNELKSKQFGKREDWLCPYYDKLENRCGIWRNRGSVCTSFYCKSSKGPAGKSFWKVALNYLSYVEMVLCEEALVHLDFSPRQVSDLLGYINRFEGTSTELKTNSLPLNKAKALWNGYFNDQESFYIKTLEVVKSFDKKQMSESMGDLGSNLTAQMMKAGSIWSS
jgi:Fe-S-cluster containining protein